MLKKQAKCSIILRKYAVKENGGIDMAFLSSLLGYLGKMVLYVILAVCGIFAGKKLRERKDAKTED